MGTSSRAKKLGNFEKINFSSNCDRYNLEIPVSFVEVFFAAIAIHEKGGFLRHREMNAQ